MYMGLALVLYGGAFAAYFLALTQLPVASVYITIVGFTAIGILLVSWVVWGEMLRATQLLGMVLILMGLIMVRGVAR